MKNYIGAYYLIKLRESDFGAYAGKKLHTCSTCINDSFFDTWSISWAEDGKKVNAETKSDFNLDEKLIKKIQNWTDQKLKENKIGWICTFADLETLNEYKNSFFPKSESEMLSINFPESEREVLLSLFNPEKTRFGEIGLSINLKSGIEENKKEQTLGYDLIGIEDSSQFHSFHCHDLASDLIAKFGIEINEFGLINENDKWSEMVKYMNDEKNGFKTSAWFYVKVNRVTKKTLTNNDYN